MQYNVEECYERLKNGFDESADMSDSDSLVYNSQIFDGDRTNAREGHTLSSEQLWATQNLPHEMSPSHFHSASWHSEQQEQELPYPSDDLYDISRSTKDTEAGEQGVVLHPTFLEF